MKKTLVLLCLLLFSTTSNALVGFGHMTKYVGSWTDDQEGEKESYFNPWPYLSIHEFLPLTGNFYMTPELGMTFKKSSYSDKNIVNGNKDEASQRQMMFLLMDFTWKMTGSTHLKFGGGIFQTKISGKGGAVTRNDGSGTVTAYLPSESVKSYNTTFDLGIETFIIPRVALKLESFTWDILSSTSRRFSFALGLNYYL
ncbi:MAG: hypothetical protein KC493_10215 [Bacteriovoracaceae bacterium]|nr:hypothetical protein [Bacteriovoracaceae bacterium]